MHDLNLQFALKHLSFIAAAMQNHFDIDDKRVGLSPAGNIFCTSRTGTRMPLMSHAF